jgi:hypothetical protein
MHDKPILFHRYLKSQQNRLSALEYWNDGRMERKILECWNIGILECWGLKAVKLLEV